MAETRTSRDIERDIERTRESAARNMNALSARISPGQMLDDALRYARTSGRDSVFLHNLRTTVRDNPVPILLMTIGIGWLMAGSLMRRDSKVAYPLLEMPPHKGHGLEHHVHVEPYREEAPEGTPPSADDIIGEHHAGKSAAESADVFEHGTPHAPILGPDGRPITH